MVDSRAGRYLDTRLLAVAWEGGVHGHADAVCSYRVQYTPQCVANIEAT
jgi:hypothetical protein